MLQTLILFILLLLLTSCSPTAKPASLSTATKQPQAELKTKIIFSDPGNHHRRAAFAKFNKSYNAVFNDLVSYLTATNTPVKEVNKHKGIIRLYFHHDDAEEFVDCGTIRVINPDGEFKFPGARNNQNFLILTDKSLITERKVSLDTEVVIWVADLVDETTVIVSVKFYVSQENISRDSAGKVITSTAESIDFPTGDSAKFNQFPASCCSNYHFERDVLETIVLKSQK